MADGEIDINSLISAIDMADAKASRAESQIVPITQAVMDAEIKLDMLADMDRTLAMALREETSRREGADADLYGRVGELRGNVDSLMEGGQYADSDLIESSPIGDRVQFRIRQSMQGLGYLIYFDGSYYQFRLYAGSKRIHGIGNQAVAQTDVQLSDANTTTWIYLNYNWATTTLSVTSSATEPASTLADLKIPLYKCTQDTSGNSPHPHFVSQVCHWGDVNIVRPAIPDTQVGVAPYKSLDWMSNGGLGLYDFEGGNADTPDALTKLVVRLATINSSEVGYITADALAQWLCDESSAIFWADSDYTTAAVGYLTTVPGLHPHATHVSFDDDSHSSAVPYMLMNANGNATRNACHASVRLGDASNNASINPAGRILYNTDGTTTVLKWDLSAWALYFTATNEWSAASFGADVTGAITLKADTACTWDFANKLDLDVAVASQWDFTQALTLNVGAASTWTFDGETKILPNADDSYILWLGYPLPMKTWASVRLCCSDIYLGTVSLADNIYYNDVAGVDIAGAVTKGGWTGAGTVKTVANLGPNDKVVVLT